MPNSGKIYAEADVATWSSGIAAGAGLHLPVGDYSSADYRSAIRFPVPAGWTGWTSITKATITVFISDHQHVSPQSSSIFCSRMTMAQPVWTKAEGSQSCESGFTAGNTSQYSDIQSVSTDRVSFTSGSTANATKTIDVTAAMRYYWGNNAKPVFVFDNNGSNQWTELWSRNKGGAYVAYISIDYTDAAPPAAPTQSLPAAGAVDQPDQPTFTWTHNDPDAQNNATVRIWDAAGTGLLYSWNPAVGSDKTLTAPVTLVHGTTYQWDVATSDAVSGYGPYSAKRAFTVKANPVVVIDTVRYMEFYNGLPRLRVKWSVTGGVQYKYRVTSGAYDSGLLTSANQSHLLDTLGLTNGTAASVTVYVETAEATAFTGSATLSFTPRWGLTTHRRDLVAAPLGWGVPYASATIPAGASLIFEYGSAATALAAPAAWFPNISSVPLAQFLYWRAWFLPNNTTGPTLDYLDIPTDNTASFVDKWGTTRDIAGLVAPWSVSNEFVYGSRSVTAQVTGAGPFYCYAYKVSVKQDRSYILTGLMKSVGNSGACIELQDAAGTVLLGGGVEFPVNTPMRTTVLSASKEWFTPDGRDVNRYKTPVWKATANMDVYVVLKAGGAAGSQAWFDAVKLEESTVATPWSPGAVGATVIDAGGVQVDAFKGGIFRLRGTDGAPRSVVESGTQGLRFAADTELSSPSSGLLAVNGQPLGGVYVGNSPPAVPSNGQLWWDDDDATVGGSQTVNIGTVFPSSPAPWDRFWRTDIGMEFYWDGSRWLSTTLSQASDADGVFLAATGTTGRIGPLIAPGCSDLWAVRCDVGFYINAGTALSGANQWVLNLTKNMDPGGGVSMGVNFTINSGAVSTWRKGTPIVLNQLLGSAFATLELSSIKTGTPGNLMAVVVLHYRQVAV